MLADSQPSSAFKRSRFAIPDPMDTQLATEKLAAAKQNYGREMRVFETTSPTVSQPSNDISNSEDQDDLEFSTEDYYRILATKKEGQDMCVCIFINYYEGFFSNRVTVSPWLGIEEGDCGMTFLFRNDKYLKTKKIRDTETAARRSKITKAVVRVRFPDNHTLEATFHPSETMQSLFDLIVKVVARPDLPFYLYTIPPKKRITDMSQDFYSAGFAPGAIVYFSYDLPQGDDTAQLSFLKEDVMSLKGLELLPVQNPEPEQPAPETVVAAVPPARKPATEKKMVKPKWLKM